MLFIRKPVLLALLENITGREIPMESRS